MRWRIMLPCLLGGCRAVFGIGDPSRAGDASVDSSDAHTGLDWDHDGIPDDVDPCPMFADPQADHDSDGDGIGDGCDPNPTTPGDTRLYWTGFDSMDVIAGWTSTGGSWSVVGGELEQSDITATGNLTIPDIRRNVFVQSELEIEKLGTSPQVGLCAYVDPMSFKCCDVTNTNLLITWSPLTATNAAWSGSIAMGQRFILTDLATDGEHTCRVIESTDTANGTLINSLASGKILVHFRQLAVAYRYLWIVGVPAP